MSRRDWNSSPDDGASKRNWGSKSTPNMESADYNNPFSKGPATAAQRSSTSNLNGEGNANRNNGVSPIDKGPPSAGGGGGGGGGGRGQKPGVRYSEKDVRMRPQEDGSLELNTVGEIGQVNFDEYLREMEKDVTAMGKSLVLLEGMVKSVGTQDDSLTLRGVLESQKQLVNQITGHTSDRFLLLRSTAARGLLRKQPNRAALMTTVDRLEEEYGRLRQTMVRVFRDCESALQDFPRNKIGSSKKKKSASKKAQKRSVKTAEGVNSSRKMQSQYESQRLADERSVGSGATRGAMASQQQQQVMVGDVEMVFEDYNEEEELRKLAEEQQMAINELLEALSALKEMFEQVAEMTVEQGEMLDYIEDTIGDAEANTHAAVVELAKAQMIDFKIYVNKATLGGLVLGAAVGACAGGAFGGPMGVVVGAGAGALIGGVLGRVGGTVFANKMTRKTEREFFQGELRENWVKDKDAPTCSNCRKGFHPLRRRTHCRSCGNVFCKDCCSFKRKVSWSDYDNLVQVCAECMRD
eukprot:TRINITY_DN1991_c1_g1_i1.p1 TRINITY_DN1991_c1_g1~~TRINITY_DN1991_c1_g1_i1.p1  ORF type:complete len:523 (-),score=149.28 TRINITY_DN1991_c1_g1_i1:27-1595(-)